mmetsp:Transcript_29887/g.82055  ORF Transcript_29887/g.82055 Transcript_29887/m.82055 type:complete len:641 (-) Transcript_29887:68-1990(-)
MRSQSPPELEQRHGAHAEDAAWNHGEVEGALSQEQAEGCSGEDGQAAGGFGEELDACEGEDDSSVAAEVTEADVFGYEDEDDDEVVVVCDESAALVVDDGSGCAAQKALLAEGDEVARGDAGASDGPADASAAGDALEWVVDDEEDEESVVEPEADVQEDCGEVAAGEREEEEEGAVEPEADEEDGAEDDANGAWMQPCSPPDDADGHGANLDAAGQPFEDHAFDDAAGVGEDAVDEGAMGLQVEAEGVGDDDASADAAPALATRQALLDDEDDWDGSDADSAAAWDARAERRRLRMDSAATGHDELRHEDSDDHGGGDSGVPQATNLSRWISVRPILVILDLNGVLLKRSDSNKKNFETRPHIERLFDVWARTSDRLLFAVWSSMASWNVEAIVEKVFGDRREALGFIWDQRRCTEVPQRGSAKPLLRKDLRQLRQSEFASFMPDHVVLVDDDPAKCVANPLGTAIHPSSFAGSCGHAGKAAAATRDTELLGLAAYLGALAEVAANGCSAREYVLSHPYVPQESEGTAGPELQPPAKKLRTDNFVAEPAPVHWPTRVLEAAPLTPPAVATSTALPKSGWRRVESRSQAGAYYYFNDLTGEHRIEPPEPWERVASRSRPDVYYYWNPLTSETSCDKPEIH